MFLIFVLNYKICDGSQIYIISVFTHGKQHFFFLFQASHSNPLFCIYLQISLHHSAARYLPSVLYFHISMLHSPSSCLTLLPFLLSPLVSLMLCFSIYKAAQSISSPLKPQALLPVVKPLSELVSEESDKQTKSNKPRKDTEDYSLR